MHDQQVKFDLLVNALSESSAWLAIYVIERPQLVYPYTVLKSGLLASHQLMDYQKIGILLCMSCWAAVGRQSYWQQ